MNLRGMNMSCRTQSPLKDVVIRNGQPRWALGPKRVYVGKDSWHKARTQIFV